MTPYEFDNMNNHLIHIGNTTNKTLTETFLNISSALSIGTLGSSYSAGELSGHLGYLYYLNSTSRERGNSSNGSSSNCSDNWTCGINNSSDFFDGISGFFTGLQTSLGNPSYKFKLYSIGNNMDTIHDTFSYLQYTNWSMSFHSLHSDYSMTVNPQ